MYKTAIYFSEEEVWREPPSESRGSLAHLPFMTRPSSNSNLITDMMMISNHFLYLLTTLPNTTAYMFPCLLVNTVPITEAKQLEITFPQLKCLAGCSQSESPP